ncbi:LuxR C-terminal-related transcriptional regulator [Streptomyces griseochromogenes]|uniref:LuxR C-terminal-related transcriptional regulator n=1 Tax=Streptomyces griseochromogenes TaxID=68214 RepID=UPI0035577DF5
MDAERPPGTRGAARADRPRRRQPPGTDRGAERGQHTDERHAAGMDGLEATRRILAEDPGCRVLMLTTFDLDRYVYEALAIGASGFLLKDVTPEHLAAAVRLVDTGDALLAPQITRRLVERYAAEAERTAEAVPAGLAALTPREREVLTLMGRGLSNMELAAELTLSEATVKSHVARIFAKLGLRDRAQVVVLAYETGLVRPGARQRPKERGAVLHMRPRRTGATGHNGAADD